jgi:hypothetical protein
MADGVSADELAGKFSRLIYYLAQRLGMTAN